MVVMDLAMAVLAMLVLATMARGLLMLSRRLMLVCTMEDMDMVLVWDMLVLDMDIPVLDILDMVVMDLDMAVLAMLVLDTTARGLLMLSQRLMLVCTMEDMDMVLVWDMLDLDMDILVLDMLAMVVMDSAMEDTVLDMDVSSMVKQLIYASKSSKVIFLLFSALIWGRKLFFMF